MDAEHTPECYARAAKFYSHSPTGQYDQEAEHALRCHFELVDAVTTALAIILNEADPDEYAIPEQKIRAALKKAKLQL